MASNVKADPANSLVSLFKSLGLSQAKAAEAAKSPKSANILKDLIEKYGLIGDNGGLDEKHAGLMVALSGSLAKLESIGELEQKYVLDRILDGKLKSVDQVSAATKYVEAHPAPVNDAEFNTECGVGFNISSEELTGKVSNFVSSSMITGWNNLGAVISAIRATPELRWASAIDIKNAVEMIFLEKFGSRESGKDKAKQSKAKLAGAIEKTPVEPVKKSVFEEGFLGSLHKPGGNPQIHPHLREHHLEVTGGAVWTRFPPEPNGYLHIGHSKAIFVNFGYAAHNGGKCYLRYDDTNPEAEEAQYFESILQTIRWLGFEPWKITYSSDYFAELYDLAVELIKRDKAYVCHCSKEQINIDRGGGHGQPKACIHRERPIQESLVEFKNMRDGKYKPREANLRMKQDLTDGNPQMWDLTAYRVLDATHHRTGDKWKIYPTYDYTHCLVDSFENISHSLCTAEFISSRQSYEWLCDALEVYKPRQSEYGRLSLEGTVMSKRKILALVTEGLVAGWDDPRLYTLIALRRRGIPPGAIQSFVSSLGVSVAASTTQTTRFEHSVRQYLESTAPRLLMVMEPLKVVIDNVPEDSVTMVTKPLHPKVPELGTTTIPFTRTIYIDADDFREADSKDYFRLAPGKTVGLFQAPHPITCLSYDKDAATGKIVGLRCRLEDSSSVKKPKAYIQWVAEHAASGSPVRVKETRIFNRLFKSDNPPSDFRSDLNPDSLEVRTGAMLEVGFWALAKRMINEARRESKARTEAALKDSALLTDGDDTPHASVDQLVGNECIRFQGLRVGYFAVDKDSRLSCLEEGEDVEAAGMQGDDLVLNRIVSLKEDSGKSA